MANKKSESWRLGCLIVNSSNELSESDNHLSKLFQAPFSLNNSIMGEKCALSDENNSLKVITGSPPLDRNRLSSANECHVRGC